jgi:hypothetical protein
LITTLKAQEIRNRKGRKGTTEKRVTGKRDSQMWRSDATGRLPKAKNGKKDRTEKEREGKAAAEKAFCKRL